jgi:transposase
MMEKTMLRLIPDSPEQVAEVRDLYHTTKDVRIRTRAQIILLAFEGLSAPQIAKIVDLDDNSVRHHIKRYRDEGIAGLPDRERSGRPRTATPEYVELALATVRRRPRALGLPFSTWSLDRLIDYLKEKTSIKVSDETIRTHLRAHGISFARPQHKVSSPDPEYVQKKRRLKTHETP